MLDRGRSADDEPVNKSPGDSFGGGRGDAGQDETGLGQTKKAKNAARLLFGEAANAGDECGDERGDAQDIENVLFR